MGKKLFLCLLSAVLLFQLAGVSPPALAADASGAATAPEPAYEGFLVAVSEGLPVLMETGELEHVADNLYQIPRLEEIGASIPPWAVEYVEPNYVVTLFPVEADADQSQQAELLDVSGHSAATEPYALMQAAFAAGYGLKGDGVRVAVIDSGVDADNANLTGVKIDTGYDYVSRSDQLVDEVYHGTKVAQCIAGSGANGAVYGIAPDVEIVPLECFHSSTGGTIAELIPAIRDAVDEYHCDVINMSWGMKVDSVPLHEALCHAYDAGVLLVAAAGNVDRRYPQGTLMYPAAYDEVIGVAAVNGNLNVAGYSQQTAAAFVSAPGNSSCFLQAGGQLIYGQGTSFAAPCVSAAAAILKQLVPELDGDGLQELLQTRAVDLGAEGYDVAYGYGFLQIASLLSTPWCRGDFLELPEQTASPAEDTPDDAEQAEPERMTIHLFGWQLHKGGNMTAAAAYDGAGRMTDIAWVSSDDPVGTFAFDFDCQKDSGRVSLFFMDRSFCPISACIQDVQN